MATLTALSDRLRAELGDVGTAFAFSATGDGVTTKYSLGYAPIDGATLVVKVNNVDVSANTSVEELTGTLIFDTAPANNAAILVSGTKFKYFTTSEMQNYVNQAFLQHSHNAQTMGGAPMSVGSLPAVEEYPVVILASTQALYTLATDASFDIDISAPDGVHIPRSERFRQLMDMVAARKEQYRELCTLLGIGIFRIEVFTLRRISRTTNRYVPIYQPQELDDRSLPRRLRFQIPDYGGTTVPDDVPEVDLNVFQNDSFEVTLDFPFDITGYDVHAQIKLGRDPHLLSILDFTITTVDAVAGTIKLSLTKQQTLELPEISYWSLKLTSPTDPAYGKTFMKGNVYCARGVTA